MNILITGGASGLGEAITRKLAQDRDNMIYFTFSKSGENAKRIQSTLPNTMPIKCDFGNAIELKSLTDSIKKLDVDVLINNAYSGEFLKSYFHKVPADEFLNDFKENIIPVIEITQAAILGFRSKKRGKIITILTSALLNTPPIGSSVYIANKAYLEKLTKVWAGENARFNISSNSVSPSFMQTHLTAGIDERLVEQIKEKHPLKNLLTVDEVAETVSFLVNASNQINGIDIVMNAGVQS
jgi:NAD(P)-dependent dehydrogenase (short-subunit alcohol dehydrogenase family)